MSTYLKSIKALYAVDYLRRTKVCVWCNTSFCDVTKRNLRQTCSDECSISLKVTTRYANGRYVTTPEQNAKRSITLREAYSSGRRTTSDVQRKKFSDTMKTSWREGKISSINHWAKTVEGRARISQAKKGRKLGPQPNMSIAAQRRLRSKREKLYTSARGGVRSDLGMYFRSTWEANFARIQNFLNKKWSYERDTFQLEESMSYTPDFFVEDENLYYEIKGRWTEKAKRQLTLMSIKFPNVIVKVIDYVEYSKLKELYRHKVQWEGK